MKLACLAQPGCHAFEVRQKDNQIVNSFPPANPLAPVGPRLYHVAAETSFTGERLQNPCIKEVATQCKNDTDAFLARWDQYVCYDTPSWGVEGCPHDPYVYYSMYFTSLLIVGAANQIQHCRICHQNNSVTDLYNGGKIRMCVNTRGTSLIQSSAMLFHIRPTCFQTMGSHTRLQCTDLQHRQRRS